MKTTTGHVNTSVEIRQLELVRLRIGYINECPFAINLHYNELKSLGETDYKLLLVSVWREAPHFSEKEIALFTLTDYIISYENDMRPENVFALLKPHFNEEQVTTLTQVVKQIDLWTRSIKHLKLITTCKNKVTKNVVI
jgi:alkylhydroperoxidase family enzyme